MQVLDLSHVMNVHTPSWVGYAGNKMYYAQNLQTQMIVAQRIETALHAGTHFDGAIHATDGRGGERASLALDDRIGRATIVDLSKQVTDCTVITPEMIMATGADIREGDILVLHTGWHRFHEGQSRQDLVRYFCFHPEPGLATLHWMLAKSIKPPEEFFGSFAYVHKRSGRRVVATCFRSTILPSGKACRTPGISAGHRTRPRQELSRGGAPVALRQPGELSLPDPRISGRARHNDRGGRAAARGIKS
jgi:kynurenine formamidase